MLKRAFVGIAILAASVEAFAQDVDVSFTYVGADYVKTFDDPADPDGFALDGSFQVHDNVFLGGRYTEYDDQGITINATNITVGYLHTVSDGTAWYGKAGYSDWGVEGYGLSGSTDGYILAAGVRVPLTRHEVGAEISYEDVDLFSVNRFEVNGRYYITDSFSARLAASYVDSSDLDASYQQVDLGFRFDF